MPRARQRGRRSGRPTPSFWPRSGGQRKGSRQEIEPQGSHLARSRPARPSSVPILPCRRRRRHGHRLSTLRRSACFEETGRGRGLSLLQENETREPSESCQSPQDDLVFEREASPEQQSTGPERAPSLKQPRSALDVAALLIENSGTFLLGRFLREVFLARGILGPLRLICQRFQLSICVCTYL